MSFTSEDFSFSAVPEAIEQCNEIIELMVRKFGIDRHEALGRLNRLFARWKHVDEDHPFFHGSSEDWACNIYYGKGSYWWLKDPAELIPLPYP